MKPTGRLLDTREAAAILNRREATLIAWRSRRTPGKPQPVRVGTRSVRYEESAILEYRDRESEVRSWNGGRKKHSN